MKSLILLLTLKFKAWYMNRFLLNKIIALFSITITLIAVWPILTYSQDISVMTYNIRYDNEWDTANSWDSRKEAVINLLNKYRPGIFGIQEGLKNQLNFINSSLTKYKYFGVGREDGIDKGEFSAVFYDTTLFEKVLDSTIWLSDTPEKVSVGWDAALERICSFGLLKEIKSGKMIWVFNTHFDHIGILAREKSSELILNTIMNDAGKNSSVILMGDLNLTPDELPYLNLNRFIPDAMYSSETPFSGIKGTFNGFTNDPVTKKIDYIFCRNIRVLSYSHINDKINDHKHISDHFPVFVKIEL